jgi:branched-chain amino acid transport system substrate-binding protein
VTFLKRGACLAIALLLLMPVATVRAAAVPDPYDIWAILPLTGANAYFGQEAHDALAVMEKSINAAGGIHGRSIRFQTLDSQSNPQVAVQLTNQLISKKLPLFIGDGSVGTCSAMQALVAPTGPVQFCLSPGITPSGFTYAVGASPTKEIEYDVRYFRKQGITKLALLLATDATGANASSEFHAAVALPENQGVTIVAEERFNPTDLGVSAQLARIRSSGAQLLIAFTSGTPFGTVLHSYRDADMTIPIFSSQGNMSFAAMKAFADLVPAGGIYFGQGPIPSPGVALPNGPLKAIQELYLRSFAEAGIQPDTPSAIIWDTVTVVVTALRAVGLDASPVRAHEYINNIHGVPGVQGMLDFRGGDQRGQDAVCVLHWARGAATWRVMPDPK